jgi:hypothetical protein
MIVPAIDVPQSKLTSTQVATPTPRNLKERNIGSFLPSGKTTFSKPLQWPELATAANILKKDCRQSNKKRRSDLPVVAAPFVAPRDEEIQLPLNRD